MQVVHIVDSLLFSILILGSLSNRDGDMWRQQAKQICVVECTLSHLQSKDLRPLSWHMKRSKVPTAYNYMLIILTNLNDRVPDQNLTCPVVIHCCHYYLKPSAFHQVLVLKYMIKETRVRFNSY